MADSIVNKANRKPAKPAKPYADFPLYAHASRRWAKKVKGRTHFFGRWDDWQAAYEKYQHDIPYLLQGKTPPPMGQQCLTVGELVNAILEHREDKVASGELAQRTWDDYKRTGEFLVKELGRHTSVESLNSKDFMSLRKKLSETRGLVALGNEIGRCRVIFNFAYKNDLIDRPVKMGLSFDKPTRKALKRERESKPKKAFTVEELSTLYQAANRKMQCFMLLGLNGALGPADIGQLEFRHIEDGWVDFPRPKTLVDRKFPLWPETQAAIEEVKQTKWPDIPNVFVTKYGGSWFKGDKDTPIANEFRKLCDECGLHQKGRGFYALRHVFRTVADGCRDKVAIDKVMGHLDASMAETYREWIEPERLQAVVDHVRDWVKPMWEVNA